MSNSSKNSEKATFIFVGLHDDFDFSRVVIADPVTNVFKKGGDKIEWVTSTPYYLGPNKEKLDIYFEIAEQIVWGINPSWPMGTKEEEKTPENVDGYQISYEITSAATVNNPTKDELATKGRFDGALNCTIAALKSFCKDELNPKVPTVTSDAYYGAMRRKNPTCGVKPVYEYAKLKDEKTGTPIKGTQDLAKPQRCYLPFATKGKGMGTGLKCDTRVYGPGDRPVPPTKFMKKGDDYIKGKCHAVIHWSNIYWGAHSSSGYGGSLKFVVSEMNFTPISTSGLSSNRMLPRNNSVFEEDDNGDDGEYGEFDMQGLTSPSSSTGKGIKDDDFKNEENVNNLIGTPDDGYHSEELKEHITEAPVSTKTIKAVSKKQEAIAKRSIKK